MAPLMVQMKQLSCLLQIPPLMFTMMVSLMVPLMETHWSNKKELSWVLQMAHLMVRMRELSWVLQMAPLMVQMKELSLLLQMAPLMVPMMVPMMVPLMENHWSNKKELSWVLQMDPLMVRMKKLSWVHLMVL